MDNRLIDIKALVRAQTQGRRTLFVSNREDNVLAASLSKSLGIKVTWCVGNLRGVDAQSERIRQGSYDIVLAATGFLKHGICKTIQEAAKDAGVRYIPVNRGRPEACMQALAREFGIGS